MNVIPLKCDMERSLGVSTDEILSGFTRLFVDLAVQADRIGSFGGSTADIVRIKAAIAASATYLFNANATFLNHLAGNPPPDTE